MNKLLEYQIKINEWVKNNPKKTTVIMIFIFGFLLGALIF